jgi:hypothetical protein
MNRILARSESSLTLPLLVYFLGHNLNCNKMILLLYVVVSIEISKHSVTISIGSAPRCGMLQAGLSTTK